MDFTEPVMELRFAGLNGDSQDPDQVEAKSIGVDLLDEETMALLSNG